MKIFFALLSFFFIFFQTSFAHSTNLNIPPLTGEHIESFNTDITVNKDGTIDVVETILYDFDTLERRGIFRNIPFTKLNDENKRVDLKFEDFTVTNGKGQNYKFEKSTENEQIVLKIGDANKIISGQHLYVISYKVSGSLGYFNEHDELYWNITGNGWQVPVRFASAHISLPSEVSLDQIESLCFSGPHGSSESNCNILDDNSTIHIETNNILYPYEGLTFVVGFPKDVVAVLLPEVHVPFWETAFGRLALLFIIFVAILWYVVLPVIIIMKYFKHGRDPYVGPNVTAWFDPPETKGGRVLTPTETGGLIDENVDVKDIFAAIIDLARRGYLKIKEDEKKKFTLIFTNKPKAKDTLLSFEKDLLDGIFEGKTEVKLIDVKFYKTVQDVEKEVYKTLEEEGFFPHNPKDVRSKYYALGTIALVTSNLILAFTAFFLGRIMPRKTLYGAQQANVARGIKSFINSQERQMNFQGDKQLFFEKLLPFAVAFGVEKNWAKRFENFDLKNPDWYQSSSHSNFATASFVNSLNSTQSSFTSSSTPPSSSGSSGFSGGSSGGGGGGGGGGSW